MKYPVLGLRGLRMLTGIKLPFSVSRPASKLALHSAAAGNSRFVVLAQKEAALETPGAGDFESAGVLCSFSEEKTWVLQNLSTVRTFGPGHPAEEDGRIWVVPSGEERFEISALAFNGAYFECEGRILPAVSVEKAVFLERLEVLRRELQAAFGAGDLSLKILDALEESFTNGTPAAHVADGLAAFLPCIKQDSLDEGFLKDPDPISRLDRLRSMLPLNGL